MVRVGEHDSTTTSDGVHQDDIRVVRSDAHSHFDKDVMIDDIAILHLARDIRFSGKMNSRLKLEYFSFETYLYRLCVLLLFFPTDHIRPICLPVNLPMRQRVFIGQNPFVAYGKPNANGSMHAQVRVISNRQCRDKYRNIGEYQTEAQFSKDVICSENTFGGAESCRVDLGGPLMLPVHEGGQFAYYQIGIVSYGVGCKRPDIPGVYTNVQHYAEWIKHHLLSN